MSTYKSYDVGENLKVVPVVEKEELKRAYDFLFDLYKGHFSHVPQTLEFELFQSGRIRIYALTKNDELVGVTGLYSHFHALKEIKYAIIQPEYRNQGMFRKIMNIIKEENNHAVILARTDAFDKAMNISLVNTGFQFLSQHNSQNQSQIVWGLNSRTQLQPQLPDWLAGQKNRPSIKGDVKILSTDKEKMAEFLKAGFVPGMKSFEKYKLFVYLYALDRLKKEAN